MMKRVLAALLAAALLLTPALAGSGDGYENSLELAPGFTYTNAVTGSGSARVETHTLTSSPGSGVYPIVLACDTIYGGFTVSQMTAYAESLGYNVVGAVNADFGESTGVPLGLVVEDGVLKSTSDALSSAVGFKDGRAFLAEDVGVTLTLKTEDGREIHPAQLNKSRTGTGAYLFSEYFSTVSTRTSGEGWFVRFEVLGGEDIRLGGELELVVTELSAEGGSVPIGRDNLVLTAAGSAGLEDVFESFETGGRVTLTAECADERLEEADYVTGAGDILIKDGSLTDSELWNGSIARANPRTALGIRSDGSVVFHVLDGRGEHSAGATLTELAAGLLDLGCVDAVNLDGGGSSIMSLRMPGAEGFTTVNVPSDGKPRSVASYILFVTDAEPSGRAERLFIGQEGAFVLAGSSVELSFAAADSALRSCALPGEISASAARGSVSGSTYTAPASAGTDTISLSGSGARGRGTLHVITRAGSLSVTADGRDAAGGLILDSGESVTLSVAAEYMLREVLMGREAVSYEVRGGVGSVNGGVFTASGAPGAEGAVVISCAGLTLELPVEITVEFEDMAGHWAAANVKSLYRQGIVSGISAAQFGPELKLKRGDFVLMLYRAAGEPAVSGASGFEDVPEGAYYAEAVAWAVENGVTTGRAEGVFAPDDTLTRQEGFTLLHRALSELGVSAPEADEALLEAFSDGGGVAGWARAATAGLVRLGVVQGSGGSLNPAGGLTRAEMAKLLDTALSLA